MIPRSLLALLLAALVTGGLFKLMHDLIDFGLKEKEDEFIAFDIDFLRVRQDSEAESKDRKLPTKKKTEKAPPPPDIDMAEAPQKPGQQNLDSPSIPLQDGVDLAGGLGLGGAMTDSDVLPLVRVEPRYPTRAQERGIEGWVHLRFTITTAGTVRDPIIVDAEPKNVFDRAATRAVLKWKYKPRIEDGKPVERHGVEVVISFDIEE